MTGRIVIATPHPRFDALEAKLVSSLGHEVIRIRDREELSRETLTSIDPAYVFFPHWSWKVPAEVYENFECVIFHMTDLPFGRGGSPLQNLIVRGFESTMLTALQCVEEMDAGPVYLKRPLALLGTAEEILKRAGELMGGMIAEILATNPRPQPQSGEVTTFRRRKPGDGALETAATVDQVYDLIRMLDADGYPAAFADVGPFRLEFARARLDPGAVLADVRIMLREGRE